MNRRSESPVKGDFSNEYNMEDIKNDIFNATYEYINERQNKSDLLTEFYTSLEEKLTTTNNEYDNDDDVAKKQREIKEQEKQLIEYMLEMKTCNDYATFRSILTDMLVEYKEKLEELMIPYHDINTYQFINDQLMELGYDDYYDE